MPMYEFACDSCSAVAEKSFPIGTAQRITTCEECGGIARLKIGAGVNISAHAFEHKGGRVREADALEGRWGKDMPAYKRMRDKGMQPPAVDGAAKLEERANDQTDIELSRPGLDGVSRERYIAAKEESAELAREMVGRA